MTPPPNPFVFRLIERIICCKPGRDREGFCSYNTANRESILRWGQLTQCRQTGFELFCTLVMLLSAYIAIFLHQQFPPDLPATWQLLWLPLWFSPSAQSTNMAFGKVTEETVYTCTGHPLKSDIANILDWMLNQDFTTAYRSILSRVLPTVLQVSKAWTPPQELQLAPIPYRQNSCLCVTLVSLL